MTLKSDIEEWLEKNPSAWPGDIEDDVHCVFIGDEITDVDGFSSTHQSIFLRKTLATVTPPLTFSDEYVRLWYSERMVGEGAEFYATKVEEVEPVEIKITKFKTKE